MNKAGCRGKLSVSRFSSFFHSYTTQEKPREGFSLQLKIPKCRCLPEDWTAAAVNEGSETCITEARGAISDNFIFCVHSIHMGPADNTAAAGASLSTNRWCGTTGYFPKWPEVSKMEQPNPTWQQCWPQQELRPRRSHVDTYAEMPKRRCPDLPGESHPKATCKEAHRLISCGRQWHL